MRTSPKIVILDDCYPFSVSGFRLAEYNFLLRDLPESRVVSSLSVLDWLDHNTSRREIKESFENTYPDLAPRVAYATGADFLSLDLEPHFRAVDLLYTVFLNNVIDLIPVAERSGTRFAFTLYPGGGLDLADEGSRSKLVRVFSHPLFAGVLITQPHTLRAIEGSFPELRERNQIEYIFGGVSQDVSTEDLMLRADGLTDEPIDICFIANRYDPEGLDKGADVYGESIAYLKNKIDLSRLRFHAIGPWRSEDFRSGGASIEIHGQIGNAELPSLLARMDIAIFPTRAGVLGVGSFDGFPVGAAIEAAKSGVGIVSTNPLRQRTPLEKGESYLEIRPTARSAAKALLTLINSPTRLKRLKARGFEDFSAVFSLESQMRPRVAFLTRCAYGF